MVLLYVLKENGNFNARKNDMRRRFIPIVFLFCFALSLTTAVPVFAETLLDVVETVQAAIQEKYPNKDSIARKMALEKLEKIARSDKSDAQIINAILEEFPEFSAGLPPMSDVNSNGIPEEWEKEMNVSEEFSSPDSDQDSDGFTLLHPGPAASPSRRCSGKWP